MKLDFAIRIATLTASAAIASGAAAEAPAPAATPDYTPPPAGGADKAPAPAATPDYTLTGNFGIYSQYIFRGLTQTDRKPAAQGGFDFAHTNGIYLGTWASNISWVHDAGVCDQ